MRQHKSCWNNDLMALSRCLAPLGGETARQRLTGAGPWQAAAPLVRAPLNPDAGPRFVAHPRTFFFSRDTARSSVALIRVCHPGPPARK